MSMTDSKRLSAVLLGAGNVATHIAKRISGKIDVVQIFSRDIENATRLSALVGSKTKATDTLENIVTDADIYIFSVKDDALDSLATRMPKGIMGVAVHTSGSAPDNALKGVSPHFGVLYPLQTFSKDIDVDWNDITVFTYGNSVATLAIIDKVAALLSPHLRHTNDVERGKLHIAAVFACNFANYMWILSDKILQKEGYDLGVFAPLIEETLRKALLSGPDNTQTGPARRGDTEIMCRHIRSLDPEEARVYRLLSEEIMKHYKINKRLDE